MSELERQTGYFEGSWVGQFRAANEQAARHFMQAVAKVMEGMGVNDVGYDVREGSAYEFSDEEAKASLVEDVVPQSVVHDSVTNTELQRQLKAARREVKDGDNEGREG